jgi:hypothetical protein
MNLGVVYVAGASSERDTRAKPVIAALRDAGFYIYHDWTEAVDMHGANNERGTQTDEALAACAFDDMWGVRAADIFVLLAPSAPSTGAWAELGLALSAGCTIFIAGKCDQCIFTWLPQCQRFESDETLVDFMTRRGPQ